MIEKSPQKKVLPSGVEQIEDNVLTFSVTTKGMRGGDWLQKFCDDVLVGEAATRFTQTKRYNEGERYKPGENLKVWLLPNNNINYDTVYSYDVVGSFVDRENEKDFNCHPSAELAFLIAEKFSYEDFEKMKVEAILVYHNPFLIEEIGGEDEETERRNGRLGSDAIRSTGEFRFVVHADYIRKKLFVASMDDTEEDPLIQFRKGYRNRVAIIKK